MMKSYTANPEAYQDYLKGRYWWNKTTEEGEKKGIEYFQQAIDIDPAYALAFSGLADCYIDLAYRGFVAPKEVYPRAKEAYPTKGPREFLLCSLPRLKFDSG